MSTFDWTLIDTETTGLSDPIFVVELAAQRMRGWEPVGSPFRVWLNHDVEISMGAYRVHGYSKDFLSIHGVAPLKAYTEFDSYAEQTPILSYNLSYDYDKVLSREWQRLAFRPSCSRGICLLQFVRQLLARHGLENFKLQTLRSFYGLPNRSEAHTALGDVRTVVDLLRTIVKPMVAQMGIDSFDSIKEFLRNGHNETVISFGQYKGRNVRDALRDKDVHAWIVWLSNRSDNYFSSVGRRYLEQIKQQPQRSSHRQSTPATLYRTQPDIPASTVPQSERQTIHRKERQATAWTFANVNAEKVGLLKKYQEAMAEKQQRSSAMEPLLQKPPCDQIRCTETREDGLSRLQDLARKGNPFAMCKLAALYLDGAPGILVDENKALELYKAAAARGKASAQVQLGTFFETGRGGVRRDFQMAAQLYQQSAANGNDDGEYNLGRFIASGLGGLQRDTQEAMRWFEKSAAKGNLKAKEAIAALLQPILRTVGNDVEVSLSISLRTALRGGNETLTLNAKTYLVTIPAGATEKTKLRLHGKGSPGTGGGADGDALVSLNIRPDQNFTVLDRDLVRVPLIANATALGHRITIPILGQNVDIILPLELGDSGIVKVPGKGFPSLGSLLAGDLYIPIKIAGREVSFDDMVVAECA